MISRELTASSSNAIIKLPGSISIGKNVNKLLDRIRKLIPMVRGWINVQRSSRSDIKRLHVAETVSLGEKRFVAVIHVDGMQFLIGGSATTVALLAQLNKPQKFCESLEQAIDIEIPKRKRKPRSTQTAKQAEGKV